MFHSVSRHNGRAKHSSLQLTANSTAAVRCLQYFCRTDLRITNHKVPLSLNAPFIQNLNRTAFSVDCNRKFFKHILSIYRIKQIDSMLPCICSVNRSQRTSKCGKNISDILGYCLVCHFFVLTTLTSSVIYYRTDAWQHGIYLLIREAAKWVVMSYINSMGCLVWVINSLESSFFTLFLFLLRFNKTCERLWVNFQLLLVSMT